MPSTKYVKKSFLELTVGQFFVWARKHRSPKEAIVDECIGIKISLSTWISLHDFYVWNVKEDNDGKSFVFVLCPMNISFKPLFHDDNEC